jgi:hypothetical protein
MQNGSVGDKGARTFAMGRGVNRAMWTWKRLVRRFDRSDFVLSEPVEAGLAKATFWKGQVASTARRLVIEGRKTYIGRALASANGLLCASSVSLNRHRRSTARPQRPARYLVSNLAISWDKTKAHGTLG